LLISSSTLTGHNQQNRLRFFATGKDEINKSGSDDEVATTRCRSAGNIGGGAGKWQGGRISRLLKELDSQSNYFNSVTKWAVSN